MSLVKPLFENRAKKLLAQGRAAWGAALPDASDLSAKFTVNTGVDFLWIDLEHRPYEVNEVRWIPIICRMKGCVPLVRVAGLDPQLIKKALDIGCSAVMVPQVNSAEEARLAVQYAKYPPEGTRGISPLWTYFMDVAWDDYLPQANQETMIVVQVESAEGMKNVEAIAQVEGVDVVFAGPTDLSAAMGHIGDIGHPDVQRFLKDFPRRVSGHGKVSGITFGGFDSCRKAYEQGYRFINFGSMLSQGTQGLAADLKRLRDFEEKSLERKPRVRKK